MADNSNNLKYDEQEAVAFIRKSIPSGVSDKYSDDEILFVVDTIWDYYESKGLVRLSQTATDDEKQQLVLLTSYVKKEIKKDDELLMDPSDVGYIVKAELAYEESIEMFGD